MIVLLEGGEGAGKTSLAKRLESEHGFIYLKFPSPKSAWERVIFSKEASIGEKAAAATLDFLEILRPFKQALYTGGKHVVMDRGPLSTVAYQSARSLKWAIQSMKAEWAIEMITHSYVLDVEVTRGLEREAAKNAVSALAVEFHTEVNARMRDANRSLALCTAIGHAEVEIEALTGKKPNHNIYQLKPNGFESVLFRAAECAHEDLTELPWKLTDAAIIDTNNSSPESTYLEILGRLGLGGEVRTRVLGASEIIGPGVVPAAAACQLPIGPDGIGV